MSTTDFKQIVVTGLDRANVLGRYISAALALLPVFALAPVLYFVAASLQRDMPKYAKPAVGVNGTVEYPLYSTTDGNSKLKRVTPTGGSIYVVALDVDTSKESVFLLDAEGKIVSVSSRVFQDLGWQPDELRGESIASIATDAERLKVEQTLSSVRILDATLPPISMRVDVRKKSGEVVKASLLGEQVRSSQSGRVFYLGTLKVLQEHEGG